MGPMQQCNLLDKGHHLYFDNFYTSVNLMEELCHKYTFACGTVRRNKVSLPKAVTEPKLIKGGRAFQRKETILAL